MTEPNVTYARRVLRLTRYVRWAPVVFGVPLLAIAALSVYVAVAQIQDTPASQWDIPDAVAPHPDPYMMAVKNLARNIGGVTLTPFQIALLLVFGIAIPYFLIRHARSARPDPAAEPAAFWTGTSALVLIGALAVDVVTIGWWFWDPPCREQNAGFVALRHVIAVGLPGVPLLGYALTWIARFGLGRRKRIARVPIGRVRAAEVVACRTVLASAAFFVLISILPFVPNPHSIRYDDIVAGAALDAARSQEQYVRQNGRFAASLADLIASDPTLSETPEVTFTFGYADETHFTFTAVHANACEPHVLGR